MTKEKNQAAAAVPDSEFHLPPPLSRSSVQSNLLPAISDGSESGLGSDH